MPNPDAFTALGKHQTTFTNLDVFDRPEHVVEVILTGEELTAFCPITHQPDFYRYEVRYRPVTSCIESKTFKLLIGSFRDQAGACILYPGGMDTNWGTWTSTERQAGNRERQSSTNALPPADVAALIVWIATAPSALVLNEAIISPLDEEGWP